MPPKALKVVVELHVQAVTCPGVFLADKDDVYLSVCILSQYKKSQCLPPVFPLLFHEKMRFEKVFKHALDPADIAQLLENETAKIQLIQLIPPEAETLASYEQDARAFLFPEPRLAPSYPGVEREVLMTRAQMFPGIAPRLEFSTRTTIKECSSKWDLSRVHDNVCLKESVRRRSSRKPRKAGCKLGPRARASAGRSPPARRERETGGRMGSALSRPRSVSPAAQRPSARLTQQLQRGSSLNGRPQFVVRHVNSPGPGSKPGSPGSLSPASPKKTRSRSLSPHSAPCGVDCYASLTGRPARRRAADALEEEFSSVDSDDPDYALDSSPLGPPRHPRTSPSTSALRSPHRRAVIGWPLRRRLPSEPDSWESIHERVRSLLTTASALQRLSFGATESEMEAVLERRSVSPVSPVLRGSPGLRD
ncbi:spermatogenesis associated 6-like protein [Amia ocellicauda]|uniref:spermatogenesis associated 6-like protein n=1 Tax=Amia ocellicauda TaxID=2972642 RepID=UPI0034646629